MQRFPSNRLPTEVNYYTGWYLLDNDGECIKSTVGSPADLIRYDKANGLIDDINIFQFEGGEPIGVTVGEPQANEMETEYTFFRTMAVCDAYEESQQNQLNQLK